MQVEERLDVMVLEGNGASVKVQQAAEVGKCDLMIAVTSADETNLLCCMVARKLGCPHTIARIRNPVYAEETYLLREELGLSMTVNPERTTAKNAADGSVDFGTIEFTLDDLNRALGVNDQTAIANADKAEADAAKAADADASKAAADADKAAADADNASAQAADDGDKQA